jgi:hypothetical protein
MVGLSSHTIKQDMKERRKTKDRRVKLPKQGLPSYYIRRIPDRRKNNMSPGWSNGEGRQSFI